MDWMENYDFWTKINHYQDCGIVYITFEEKLIATVTIEQEHHVDKDEACLTVTCCTAPDIAAWNLTEEV
jgi:uncharacterized beta-barrel protein YwiB (DUF1934 family)